MEPSIGVLALQGDFEAHGRILARLGPRPIEIRRPNQLAICAGLVLPGGESTTLLNLMADEPWFEELRRFHARGGGLLATCAGAILLAREVTGSSQQGLGLIDITIRRNAYGRQVDSFETSLEVAGREDPSPAVFIRAPVIERTGPSVEVLARCPSRPASTAASSLGAGRTSPARSRSGPGDDGQGEGPPAPARPQRAEGDPVLVREGGVLAATFHPELTGDVWLHRLFLEGINLRGPRGGS